MNPAGFLVPPATVFPRNRTKPEHFKNAPEGTVPISDGGFINKELYTFMLHYIIIDFF
jgi:hypothetical protein